jgi:hypothetical protein
MFGFSQNTPPAPDGVTLPTNPDGSPNKKYVDLLSEDPPIANQKYCCVSFISPEKILKQREMFFFNEFVKQWSLNKAMDKFTKFVSFLAYKYHLKFDDVVKDLEGFTKEEQQNLLGDFTIEDEYKTFIDKNEEKLQQEFDEAHNFQTNVRGIKVRGCYNSQKEAELRAKTLREWEDGAHEIYVGQVGIWMPFHPEAYKTGRVEYLEPELNQLMHEKNENEKRAKDAFDQRVKDTRKKAIEENEKIAEKSGNVLTQTINNNGELVSIDGMNTTENNLLGKGEEVSSADIRSQLFEGDDIVTSSMMKEREDMAKAYIESTDHVTE